jgi:hypothetical protein
LSLIDTTVGRGKVAWEEEMNESSSSLIDTIVIGRRKSHSTKKDGGSSSDSELELDLTMIDLHHTPVL